ncbi:hypothetical protein GCM10010446_32290 [Streptomyces enissocaesilis]|uniref:Uncharacterized protein n=1 Tax=Streptomyces enissocaesilis TaxID=332589 RepID=A0ABP6JU38_9ACTN
MVTGPDTRVSSNRKVREPLVEGRVRGGRASDIGPRGRGCPLTGFTNAEGTRTGLADKAK